MWRLLISSVGEALGPVRRGTGSGITGPQPESYSAHFVQDPGQMPWNPGLPLLLQGSLTGPKEITPGRVSGKLRTETQMPMSLMTESHTHGSHCNCLLIPIKQTLSFKPKFDSIPESPLLEAFFPSLLFLGTCWRERLSTRKDIQTGGWAEPVGK